MTQPVFGIAPVAAAVAAPVVVAPPAWEEPTMDELAASMSDPTPEAEPVVEAPVTEPEPTTDAKTEPAEAAAVDEALERATKAAQRAREGSRRYAATQEALARERAEVQRAAQQAEAYRQRVAQAEVLERELKDDPYKALKSRGMTDADLAARAMRENTPEARVMQLQEQLDREAAARVALETRLENQRRDAEARDMAQRAEAAFIKAADNEAAFPELARLTAEGQLDVARRALDRIKANGHAVAHLTNAQIAEAAEKYIKMTRKPTAAAPKASAPAVRPAAPSGATLTNRMVQTRTVAPGEWDSLSDEQQLAHIAASLPDPG